MQRLFSHIFLFVLFLPLLGVFAGVSGCGKRPPHTTLSRAATDSRPARAININSATAADLEELPHLGAVLAARIIEHRNRHGPFRRLEHLLAVEGISEKRYRELEQFIDIK